MLLEELETVTSILSAIEAKKDIAVKTKDEVIDELELDVTEIMKAYRGVWTKKGLMHILKKTNPKWEAVEYPTLMELLSFAFTNPYIKRVKPYGWQFCE